MIFNVPGHIEMIRNGLYSIFTDRRGDPLTIVKTETRRLNRGVYQIEAERKKPHKIGYAVQERRGVKAEPGLRIVMDRIWEERVGSFLISKECKTYPVELLILEESARAEGGYTPEEYEKVFRDLNPKWDGWTRWAYKFHAIKVQT